MTGEDLGLKASTVEKEKFEYSSLGKIFNKRFSEDDKKSTFEETKKYWKQKWNRVTSN